MICFCWALNQQFLTCCAKLLTIVTIQFWQEKSLRLQIGATRTWKGVSLWVANEFPGWDCEGITFSNWTRALKVMWMIKVMWLFWSCKRILSPGLICEGKELSKEWSHLCYLLNMITIPFCATGQLDNTEESCRPLKGRCRWSKLESKKRLQS